METYCGANCGDCPSRQGCKGCAATCGSPFGGRCVAAEYIKLGGREAYAEFKRRLTDEVNAILVAEGLPAADSLTELVGKYVNLEYALPNGGKARFLNDRDIYLGAQIELTDTGFCGVIAAPAFLLVCRYGMDGSEPELVLYRKR